MKRNLLVLLAVMLLAAPAAVGVADEVAVEGAVAAIGSIQPDCDPATSAEGAEASLEEILAPEGTPRSITCGSCSDSACVGQAYGAYCGFSGGQFKTCRSLLGYLCPGESAWDCQCSSQPYY